jgi:MFS family permease
LPDNAGLISIGVALSWFFSAFPQAIALPDIIEAVTEKKI